MSTALSTQNVNRQRPNAAAGGRERLRTTTWTRALSPQQKSRTHDSCLHCWQDRVTAPLPPCYESRDRSSSPVFASSKATSPGPPLRLAISLHVQVEATGAPDAAGGRVAPAIKRPLPPRLPHDPRGPALMWRTKVPSHAAAAEQPKLASQWPRHLHEHGHADAAASLPDPRSVATSRSTRRRRRLGVVERRGACRPCQISARSIGYSVPLAANCEPALRVGAVGAMVQRSNLLSVVVNELRNKRW